MVLTALFAAQYAGTLDLSDASRIAARHTEPPPILAGDVPKEVVIASDVSTVPSARLRMADRRWEFAVGYSPSITALDVEQGVNLQVFHVGTATLAWHDRFTRVTVSEGASFGQFNSALLYAAQAAAPPSRTQPPVIQSTPSPVTIDVGSSNTGGTFSHRLSRLTTLSFSAAYNVSGGTNQAAQTQLPKQWGPRFDLSASYEFSRSDKAITLAIAQETWTSGPCLTPNGQPLPAAPGSAIPPFCQQQAPVAQLLEVVSHRLSRVETISAGLGVAVAIVTVPTEQAAVIQPTASATLTRRLDAEASNFALSAQMAPFVDVRTGLADQQIQATATVTSQLEPKLTVLGGASFLQSVPLPANSGLPVNAFNITGIGGNLELRVALDRQLDLVLGAQELWQEQEGFPTFSTTIGSVGLIGRARTLHF